MVIRSGMLGFYGERGFRVEGDVGHQIYGKEVKQGTWRRRERVRKRERKFTSRFQFKVSLNSSPADGTAFVGKAK